MSEIIKEYAEVFLAVAGGAVVVGILAFVFWGQDVSFIRLIVDCIRSSF